MTLPITAAPALSAELRARTAAAHDSAEHSPYMTALVGGRVTGIGLAALLSRLAPVYAALERLGDGWSAHPVVGDVVLPELRRSERLADDLRHLTGCDEVALSPASVAYAARIEEVGRTSAPAFLAHHCTRYLGDLSGGQVIRAALERSLGVTDGAGASFFAFPDVRPAALKKRYRQLLDEIPFDAAQREELVAEALVAYHLNVALAAELDRDLARWTTA